MCIRSEVSERTTDAHTLKAQVTPQLSQMAAVLDVRPRAALVSGDWFHPSYDGDQFVTKTDLLQTGTLVEFHFYFFCSNFMKTIFCYRGKKKKDLFSEISKIILNNFTKASSLAPFRLPPNWRSSPFFFKHFVVSFNYVSKMYLFLHQFANFKSILIKEIIHFYLPLIIQQPVRLFDPYIDLNQGRHRVKRPSVFSFCSNNLFDCAGLTAN